MVRDWGERGGAVQDFSEEGGDLGGGGVRVGGDDDELWGCGGGEWDCAGD